jgi:hypothetical protein
VVRTPRSRQRRFATHERTVALGATKTESPSSGSFFEDAVLLRQVLQGYSSGRRSGRIPGHWSSSWFPDVTGGYSLLSE